MQKAIDYIEEHLTGSVDYDMVAAQSFSSSYHFQRVFHILCGFTIGEYIRNRRLSLAGIEISASDAKVIDIALKYGYEQANAPEISVYHWFRGDIQPKNSRYIELCLPITKRK